MFDLLLAVKLSAALDLLLLICSATASIVYASAFRLRHFVRDAVFGGWNDFDRPMLILGLIIVLIYLVQLWH